MNLLGRCDLRSHPSLRRGGVRPPLQSVALCAVAAAILAFTAGIATAATDPDWTGTAPTNISGSPEIGILLHPAIAVGPSGPMVAAWNYSGLEERDDIYVTLSHDQGSTWSTPVPAWDTDGFSQLPDAIIAQGTVYVAWTENESSENTFTVYAGELGSAPRAIPVPAADTPSNIPTRPRLAAGPDRLHVVFNAGAQFELNGSHIFYSSLAPEHTTWTTATQVFAGTDVSWFPALAVAPDGEALHVVWEEKKVLQENRSVQYVRGTASGSSVSWAPPTTLSVGVNSVKPDVAVSSGGDVHVIWGEVVKAGVDSEYYVSYRRYDSDSDSWLDAERVDALPVYVNEATPTESPPRLALWEAGDQVHICVAWHGCRDSSQCAEDALLSCSRDGGKTWRSVRTMSPCPEGIDEEADISIWPSVTFDTSGTLHGVWRQRIADSPQDDYEIYYAHSFHTVFLPLVIRNA